MKQVTFDESANILHHENDYQKHGTKAQRSYPNEAFIQFLAQNFFSIPYSERRNIRVLELGCGSGANLWMVAKEGFDTYGLDGSETALKLAAEHLGEKWNVTADLKVGSFTALDYPPNYFDAVFDVLSLCQIPLSGMRQTLQQIRTILKSGGKFFSYRLADTSATYLAHSGPWIDEATVPNIDNPSLPYYNNAVNSFWSPALVRREYSQAGLTLKGIDLFSRTYPKGATWAQYLAITAQKLETRI